MTQVRFYHLTRRRLDQALPGLVQKALERGHRIVVRTGSRERAEALNATLWTFDAASFIPHGYLRDGFEREQPVFLTDETDNPNGADVLFVTDGAGNEGMEGYHLCCDIFDGNDPAAVEAARARYAAAKQAGHEVTYYQQDEQGLWAQK